MQRPRGLGRELLVKLVLLVLVQEVGKVSEMATEKKDSKKERSFIMVKPDGVQRGLIGEIIKRFEQKGFKLVAMKFMQVGW